ncbi:MAG: hypothetical protein ACD_3C00057G0003 [uncultured bacterium (gcode 4)]|uniref:Type II CBASS E2 protein domain-containing protein n=1 Tax=uncultured bacterium (gcode 4) TaxID=1234023 RepID=K2FZR3_9BACT|nr:MAG: hypothetical protein ACD_3C00057G0003 [uncultured bacterium (gcode 4)]
MQMPEWIKRNPEKNLKRIQHESEKIRNSFPSFELLQKDDLSLYWKGQLATNCKNVYSIEIHYTDEYPYSPPIALVLDKDVKNYCLSAGLHGCHNWGEEMGGIHVCVIDPKDTVNVRWHKDHSAASMIIWTAEWLHAYEVKRVTGKWILPE